MMQAIRRTGKEPRPTHSRFRQVCSKERGERRWNMASLVGSLSVSVLTATCGKCLPCFSVQLLTDVPTITGCTKLFLSARKLDSPVLKNPCVTVSCVVAPDNELTTSLSSVLSCSGDPSRSSLVKSECVFSCSFSSKLDVHLYGCSWELSQLCPSSLPLYVTARLATKAGHRTLIYGVVAARRPPMEQPPNTARTPTSDALCTLLRASLALYGL